MKKLIEHIDGWRWHDGDTSSMPFEKDSELYQEKLAEGYEVVEIPQAEKDAYAEQEARDSILSELSALDFPIHKIERALTGDQQAIDDIKTNEIKKNELRKKLGQV